MWPRLNRAVLVALHVAGILITVGLMLAGLLTPQQLALVALIYSAAASCVIGLQMKRKIRKELGRKADDLDLASIDTWMEVEEAEEQERSASATRSASSSTKIPS